MKLEALSSIDNERRFWKTSFRPFDGVHHASKLLCMARGAKFEIRTLFSY